MSFGPRILDYDPTREIFNLFKTHFAKSFFVLIASLGGCYYFFVTRELNSDKKERNRTIVMGIGNFVVAFLPLLAVYKGIPNLHDKVELLKIALLKSKAILERAKSGSHKLLLDGIDSAALMVSKW